MTLSRPLYCLPTDRAGNDPRLPEGTPVRDVWRGDDYGPLGESWRFLASIDGGKTWGAYQTMLDQQDSFPIALGGSTRTLRFRSQL